MEIRVVFEKQNNIQVAWNTNRSELVVCVPFKEKTSIYKLPEGIPSEEAFISLVLHQSDLKIAYEYLSLITNDQIISIRETLFMSALNNCIKCFKRCKSRQNLIKKEVFQNERELFDCFSRFECIRDRHYAHDENGMLQPIAAMFLSEKENSDITVFRPWVIWNREQLDFIQEAILLKKVVEYIISYIQEQLDSLAMVLVPYFAEKFKLGDKLELVDSVVQASYDVERNSSGKQFKKIPVRIMYTNIDGRKNN